MTGKQPSIDLYTTQTPNGIKISITLEELNLPYKTHKIDISKDEQKTPEFLAINPNGRIPALTDTHTDGSLIRLFESGSIMQYLVATYDKDFKISFPPGSREFFEMNNWLFFMNAGVGPMQGQANHFTRYAPEKIQYGINRYQIETRRLYRVLDKHLTDTKSDYLVANKCTIADIAHYGWIAAAGWAGVEIEEFPALKAWEERMEKRPAVAKGRDVPDKHNIKERMKDKESMKQMEEKGRNWVQSGMKADAQK